MEKFNGFKPLEAPREEKILRPGEKLEGFQRQLWEQARKVISALGFNFDSEDNLEKENELVGKIKEFEKLEKDDEHNDDYLFLETDLETSKGRVRLRIPAQIDEDYDPGKLIDYEKENPGFEAESKRWLGREIMILEKLDRFRKGDPVLADTLLEANRVKESDEFFLLKKIEASDKEFKDFGEAEGRALAETLLNLQYRVDATGLIKEIMEEEKLKTKYELENNVMEDYFDDKQGYLDNIEGPLEGLPEDLRQRAWKEMKKQLEVVDADQLEEGQYALVYGNCSLDNLVLKNGKILLSDWKRPGTTLNRQLALTYDLANAYMEARERFEDEDQANAFLAGIENKLKEDYRDKQFGPEEKKISGADMADAVIKLIKLRAYTIIESDDLIKKELV